MPNIDPRQLKRMMDSMGIKSTEIEAERVVIQAKDRDIVIEDPQITAIDAQGSRSFQISGTVREVGKIATAAEISDEDVKMVSEQSGVNDLERARKALEESGGDIAGAIIRLKG
ncbi:MAG: nascent polypeptide-associated complex protein [Candidatus Micrarchaeaceae archaeon]